MISRGWRWLRGDPRGRLFVCPNVPIDIWHQEGSEVKLMAVSDPGLLERRPAANIASIVLTGPMEVGAAPVGIPPEIDSPVGF